MAHECYTISYAKPHVCLSENWEFKKSWEFSLPKIFIFIWIASIDQNSNTVLNPKLVQLTTQSFPQLSIPFQQHTHYKPGYKQWTMLLRGWKEHLWNCSTEKLARLTMTSEWTGKGMDELSWAEQATEEKPFLLVNKSYLSSYWKQRMSTF